MATRAQALDTLIDATIAQLNAVMAAPNPKPTYTVDGETYQWAEYVEILSQRLLEFEQARQRADGAWEVRSVGA